MGKYLHLAEWISSSKVENKGNRGRVLVRRIMVVNRYREIESGGMVEEKRARKKLKGTYYKID